MKKAKLVQVVFTTRVVVDEDENGNIVDWDGFVSNTKKNILTQIENDEVEENIETYFDDEEVPYGSLDNEN